MHLLSENDFRAIQTALDGMMEIVMDRTLGDLHVRVTTHRAPPVWAPYIMLVRLETWQGHIYSTFWIRGDDAESEEDLSRPRYDWWPYVKGMIRRYPALKEQYAELHTSSMTANYSGMPRSGAVSRGTEDIAARELPSTRQREYEAVRLAIQQTERYPNGRERLAIIRMVLWDRQYTLEGAALMVPCSAMTARRYHTAFIMRVAKNFGLLDEDEPQEPCQ